MLQPLWIEQERATHSHTYQVNRHIAAAGSGKLASEKYVPINLQTVGLKRGAGVVAQLCPVAGEVAADVGAKQADRTELTSAGGHEPITEEHASSDLQAGAPKRGTGVVAQLCPVAAEVAADVGAKQADGTELASAGGYEPAMKKYASADLQALAVKRGAGVVA